MAIRRRDAEGRSSSTASKRARTGGAVWVQRMVKEVHDACSDAESAHPAQTAERFFRGGAKLEEACAWLTQVYTARSYQGEWVQLGTQALWPHPSPLDRLDFEKSDLNAANGFGQGLTRVT